ncbi:MAG TPA: hypothetical protein VNL14_17385 [Candidatus Acidoferrales bacterium]|nr:hypothetical protein [Candidatus Acidoferrales bacterium]
MVQDGGKNIIRAAILLALGLSFWIAPTYNVLGHELRGFVELESRLFLEPPIHSGQERHSFSLAVAPQYYRRFADESVFIFTPFLRLDSADSRRTHFDVRELLFIRPRSNWQVRLGAGRVFWGVTETQHLVDIINQTDFVEDIDGEDKLGQPMVNVSLTSKWGGVDFYLLPYFRERTFPGRGGRLRPSIHIDTGRAIYESSAEEWHPDIALRYFHSIGKWDVGLSYFRGTGREPGFRVRIGSGGKPFLIPFYEQIQQVGLESLYVTGSWIWKLEAIYRRGQGDENFFAWTGGLEYTFSGIAGTGMDLGVLTEWSYDTRGKTATTPLQNDIAFGVRLGVNDAEGTQLLFAVAQDLKTDSQFLFLEASTLITEHWKLTIDVRAFFPSGPRDLLYDVRKDHYIRTGLAYHF